MVKKEHSKSLWTKIIFLASIILVWQLLYMVHIWPPILFPSFSQIVKAFFNAFLYRNLWNMLFHSFVLLLKGLFLGIIIALILSGCAVMNRIFFDIYNMIVSMFDLIPGIALIPVAILWLGIGDEAIVFMVFHSVVWPLSRSILGGFNAVPKIYLEVGQNMGLKNVGLVFGIFFPAALPNIFSGLKVGWARAWRGLISAEMVFGGGSALGIGYFITDRRTNMDIAGIFAAIIVIIIIGLLMEYGLFRIIEKNTLKKWGMIR